MRNGAYDMITVAMQLKAFIKTQRNYRNPLLTLDDVCGEVGVSRSTVVKVFREEMHTTFNAYVNKCRLQAARHLLMQNNGRFTMEHIALVAGYGSRQTFVKKYKEKYGEPPSVTASTLLAGSIN